MVLIALVANVLSPKLASLLAKPVFTRLVRNNTTVAKPIASGKKLKLSDSFETQPGESESVTEIAAPDIFGLVERFQSDMERIGRYQPLLDVITSSLGDSVISSDLEGLLADIDVEFATLAQDIDCLLPFASTSTAAAGQLGRAQEIISVLYTLRGLRPGLQRGKKLQKPIKPFEKIAA